jgi:hypothetical protein
MGVPVAEQNWKGLGNYVTNTLTITCYEIQALIDADDHASDMAVLFRNTCRTMLRQNRHLGRSSAGWGPMRFVADMGREIYNVSP